jgi:hypothetical protein
VGLILFPLRFLWRLVTTLFGFALWGFAVYGLLHLAGAVA